jgi:hypothetical protein
MASIEPPLHEYQFLMTAVTTPSDMATTVLAPPV